MADAKLGKQRIDGSDLNAVPTAFVAQVGRVDMVAARRYNHGNVREPVDDLRPGARAAPTLQQLLKYQTGRVDRLATSERLPQAPHLGAFRRRIPSERQGPDAGIDEQAHLRVRSRL